MYKYVQSLQDSALLCCRAPTGQSTVVTAEPYTHFAKATLAHCPCRWALILQAEAVSGLFQDALPGLDLLSFSLPIETPPVLPAAVAANALLTSVGDLFRRQQSHYRTSTSQAPSSAVQSKSSRRDESAAHQPRSDAPSKR